MRLPKLQIDGSGWYVNVYKLQGNNLKNHYNFFQQTLTAIHFRVIPKNVRNCVLIMSGMLLGACAPLSELDGSGSVMPSQRAVQSQSAKLDSAKAQGSMLHLDGAKVSTLTSDDNNFNVVAQQRGQASWYGGRFHGRKTASGERFDMHGDTAAHRTWPLGTWVRVTNLRNQRSVILRINDRGPFHSKRILDVSKSAAHRLDFHQHGNAPVLLERLRSKPAAPGGASAATDAAAVPAGTPN